MPTRRAASAGPPRRPRGDASSSSAPRTPQASPSEAARCPPARSGGRGDEAPAAGAAAVAAQHADRHVRRADDGDRSLRPLPRLGCRTRTAAGRESPGRPGRPRKPPQREQPHRLTPGSQGCGPPAGHGWDSGRDGSSTSSVMDRGWLKEPAQHREFALGFYAKGGLGFIHRPLADAATLRPLLLLAPRLGVPDREYMWAASHGIEINDRPARPGGGEALGPTLFAAVERAGDHRGTTSTTAPCGAWGSRHASTRANRVEYAATRLSASCSSTRRRTSGGSIGSPTSIPSGDVRGPGVHVATWPRCFEESPQWGAARSSSCTTSWGSVLHEHAPAARSPTSASSGSSTRTSARWASVPVSPFFGLGFARRRAAARSRLLQVLPDPRSTVSRRRGAHQLASASLRG